MDDDMAFVIDADIENQDDIYIGIDNDNDDGNQSY